MSRRTKTIEKCPACDKQGDYARGFCRAHYIAFRKACIENGSWDRNVEVPGPIREKWAYEGREDELIDALTQQGRDASPKK